MAGKTVIVSGDTFGEGFGKQNAMNTELYTDKHAKDGDTALGTLGTKATPIDADKIVQRDSASSDALVTSSWAQIKAFLKTYFDTLYNKYTLENHASNHVDGTDDIRDATASVKGLATAAQITSLAGAVQKATYNAHSILQATTDDTPAVLTVGEQTVVGRITAGNITALTATQLRALIAIQEYETVYIDAGALVPTTTNGATTGTNEYVTNDIEMDYFAFDDATLEKVQFKMAMPENWDRSTIKAKFFWTSATGSTTADTVEWGIKAGALSDSDAIDATLGTGVVISDA